MNSPKDKPFKVTDLTSAPHWMTKTRPRPSGRDAISLDEKRLERARKADGDSPSMDHLRAELDRVIARRCGWLKAEVRDEYRRLPPIAIRGLAQDIDWIECEADLEEWLQE